MKNNIISSVGVIGAGQMGRGIAQVFATGGFDVVLQDVREEALTLAKKEITTSLEKLQSKNLLPADMTASKILQHITFSQALQDVKNCGLLVEAIVENLEVKKSLYEQLQSILPPDATTILASNTSALSIAALQSYSPRPENFLGIHFMNPAPLMPLVEIITTEKTAGGHGDFIKDIIEKRLSKQAVVLQDTPGFILNRLLLPYLNEAVKLLEQKIATAQDIDKAMMLGAGYKMGPLALLDFIGLDTCQSILQTLADATGQAHYQPATLLSTMVANGRLGRKNKKGFYDYPSD